MKKITFLMLFLVVMSCANYEQNVKIMSYNIRYDNPNDGENQWSKRKKYLSNQIAFYAPDLLGIQEGLSNQIDYLDKTLFYYNYIGVGRDDGKEKGEYCAILYNSKIFEVLEHDTFWLSETPNKVSIGWDADLERICTYAMFQIKNNGSRFWVFNTHFDHIGMIARQESSELILKKIKLLNKDNLPVILMGDFNSEPDSEPIGRLLKKMNAAKSVSISSPFGSNGTFNGFDFCKPIDKELDYIFTSKNNISVIKHATLSDSKDGKYPSDHLPVFAEIKIHSNN